ncbi:response regulator [Haloarcula marismortui]|uniref:Response regulator n=1 Tax=Haloarcula marismortui ATCC 33800 TaxID=662476 RepID=M0JLS0_9EURY|nr:response regulator [Haloarcula sinaiiensis]EMA08934.1 response regulator [Haloarcula sinaiiensis ATCC 33800]QUJ74098.1 response regulator [Haloarcula sinaiiensis ATCC 33800]
MQGNTDSGDNHASVLLVGATPMDARVISCGLKREDISMDIAADIRTVIDRLTTMCEDETTVASSCLVAIDFTTAPADGLTVLNAIRASPRLQTLPAIALVNHTVAPDEAKERIQSAYEHGVNGHISGASDIETYADAIQEFAAFWFSQVSLPPQSLYSDSATISYD